MKKLTILLLTLTIIGCKKQDKIKTIIKETDNYVISINYPITDNKKINKQIKKYVNDEYKNFIKQNNEEKQELNIDFKINDNEIIIYSNNNKKSFKYKKESNTIETYKYISKTKELDINKKSIALTFDDGPSKYTKKIIDLLNEYDANATFFILGNKVELYNDTLKYMLESGNEIGNHSYNHKWLTHVDEEELLNQINKTQEIIKNNLGYEPKIFRPTYGSVSKLMRKTIDLDIILWNIDTMDWKYKNKNKIINNIMSQIEDGKIILMHDTKKITYETLKQLLPKLKEQGYQFVTVSELKEIKTIREKT